MSEQQFLQRVFTFSGRGGLDIDRAHRAEPPDFDTRALAIAASLPGDRHLVVLCEDRCRFLLMFAAACLRRSTIILPPSRGAEAVAELLMAYPGCVVVDDTFTAAASSPPFEATESNVDFTVAIGHTSGSTGAPVAHPKSLHALTTTTALNAATLRAELARQGLSSRPWLVATVPSQHMYGLETSVLLPLFAGFGIHCGRPLLPSDVADALSDVPSPRVLVSTPVHLRALADSTVRFPDVAVVVSATAPLTQDLAHQVEERFGATLIEFFGSTETCVIAVRRTAQEVAWRPYPGIRLRQGDGGTVVSAPWFTKDQQLHDIVDVRHDGTFIVVGRGNDVIEVAGKRASLSDLTRRLLAIEGIVDAIVFQPPTFEGGVAGRCAALVVGVGLTAQDAARHMRRQVDAAFVPRPIVMVDKLPRNEVGKLSRESLLELLATSSALQPRRGK